MFEKPIHRPLVIVGVDGSDEGARAVAWAAEYVNNARGTLELVTTWHWPAYIGYPAALPDYDPELIARTIVEKAAADVSLPPDRIRTTVVGGPAGQRLVAASEHADLLVVGSHGLGSFSSVLLGSVSAHCVHHAHCPVVVVRATQERA